MQYNSLTAGLGERMYAIAPVTVFIVDRSSIIQERLVTMLAELDGVEVVGQAQNETRANQGLDSRTKAGRIRIHCGEYFDNMLLSSL